MRMPAAGTLFGRTVPVLFGIAALTVLLTGAPAQAAEDGAALAVAFGCAECHGADGIGVAPGYPNLAGQDKRYLKEQLIRFRAPAPGQLALNWSAYRFDHVMGPKAKPLGDADVERLAAYFSGLDCSVPRAADTAPQPKMAARCLGCHGEDAVKNSLAAVPSLFGQKAPYLERQLQLFRATAHRQTGASDKSRRFHPAMDLEAGVLDSDSITALAMFFSGRGCR